MIPSHVTAEQTIEVAVKLVRALSYKRAQADAIIRQIKNKDVGLWADHAASVYRHELLRELAKVEAVE